MEFMDNLKKPKFLLCYMWKKYIIVIPLWLQRNIHKNKQTDTEAQAYQTAAINLPSFKNPIPAFQYNIEVVVGCCLIVF